jgi:hypothetical protein
MKMDGTDRLRKRLVGAACVGAGALAATLTMGATVASATPPSDPALGTAPHFYNGNVEAIRDSGSDTTFFLMQKIADLYTGAGLYGCTLNSSAGQTLFNSGDPASTSSNLEYYCIANGNVDTTDVNDNWDRTEVSQGVDDVGSGAGQNQLCAALSSPLTVDFARSSKPITGACGTEAETGYAKDGVPVIDFTTVNPSTYGTSSFSTYAAVNGGSIGPVANGWLPGDAVGGPYNGTAFSDVSNADNGGGANSTAYRLWCATGATRITDWGQLTNLGPNLEVVNVTTTTGSTTATVSGTFPSQIAGGQTVTGTGIPASDTVSSVSGGTLTLTTAATTGGTVTLTFGIGTPLAVGQGVPIGLPVRIVAVNTASGTEATFASYAESGVSSGGCASSMNTNGMVDPNSATNTGDNAGVHIALENNASQISQFDAADFPSDAVDQAVELATSLYIESNGVYNTNPYAAGAPITNGTSTVTYAGNKVTENEKSTTTPNLLNNFYPTARTLFNIYRTDTVRASTAGFLNWICDSNTDFTKGIDNSTGKNFDTELSTLINTTYGFVRLTDTSANPSNGGTPADNQAAPNTTCASALNGAGTAGNGIPAITTVASAST